MPQDILVSGPAITKTAALRPPFPVLHDGCDYSSGTSSKATMLMILISGLMAGPAVSL